MTPKSNFLAWMKKRFVWRWVNTAFKLKYLIQSMKHVGGLGLLCCLWTKMVCNHWWSFEFWVVPADSTGKSPGICLWNEVQQILNIQSRSTKEWLEQEKVHVLERLSQSTDLNPIEVLWKHLKWAVHTKKPINFPELWLFCKSNGLNFLQADVRADKLLQETFCWSYYCERGSHQLLTGRRHILSPHTIMSNWIPYLNKYMNILDVFVSFVWLVHLSGLNTS